MYGQASGVSSHLPQRYGLKGRREADLRQRQGDFPDHGKDRTRPHTRRGGEDSYPPDSTGDLERQERAGAGVTRP